MVYDWPMIANIYNCTWIKYVHCHCKCQAIWSGKGRWAYPTNHWRIYGQENQASKGLWEGYAKVFKWGLLSEQKATKVEILDARCSNEQQLHKQSRAAKVFYSNKHPNARTNSLVEQRCFVWSSRCARRTSLLRPAHYIKALVLEDAFVLLWVQDIEEWFLRTFVVFKKEFAK